MSRLTTPGGRNWIRDTRARAAPQTGLELCTEILSLVEMLTGDTAVAKAFMGEELRSRLAGMLLSVVRQFKQAVPGCGNQPVRRVPH